MMKITTFLLIVCFMHTVSCKRDVAILTNKPAEYCPSTSKSTVGIPIKSTLMPINEFTFCGKYRFKILKDVVLMYMNSPEVYVRIMDFDEKVGLVKHELITYFFFFPNQTINPDSWQHVCLAVSDESIKLVLNGEVIYNAPPNTVTNGFSETYLWLGGENMTKFMHRRFEGVITNAYLWNVTSRMDDLISITSKNR